MKFTVSRKTWFRGKGEGESKLLRTDGARCCIGFVGQQCGVPDSAMLSLSAIRRLELDHVALFPQWMRDFYGYRITEAYGLNDDPDITDSVRESRLITLFESQGDTIEFVD